MLEVEKVRGSSETESETMVPKPKQKSETAGAIGVGPGLPYHCLWCLAEQVNNHLADK